MGAIHLDNRLVHYEVIGQAGQPVIFLHSWVGSWRYWVPMMDELAKGYRSYGLDFWGFGESQRRGAEFTVPSYVAMLLSFMDQMGIPQAHLVGHGLGGMVAIRAAAERPERFRRLATVATPLYGSVLAKHLRPGIFSRLLGRSSTANVWARMLRQLPLGDPEIQEEVYEDTDGLSEELVSSLNASMLATDLRPDLERLRVPLLAVHGDRDPIVPAESSILLFDGQTSELLWPYLMVEASHFPFLEQPDKFSRVLVSHLRGADRPPVEQRDAGRGAARSTRADATPPEPLVQRVEPAAPAAQDEQPAQRAEPAAPADLRDQLSVTMQNALLIAESLRELADERAIDGGHLLAGMFAASRSSAYQLLTLFDDEQAAWRALCELAGIAVVDAPLGQIYPPEAWRFKTAPIGPRLAETLRIAHEYASKAKARTRDIHQRHILRAMLADQSDPVGAWIARRVGVERPELAELLELSGSSVPIDLVRALSSRGKPGGPKPTPAPPGPAAPPRPRAAALAAIKLRSADFLRLDADAYVVSTNTRLALGTVGLRLREAMGRAYDLQLAGLQRPVPLGAAAVLEAEGLRARLLIHVPIYAERTPTTATLVEGLGAALREAGGRGLRSLVVPTLGSSWGDLPVESAGAALAATLAELEAGSSLEEVTFAHREPAVLAAYEAALGQLIAPPAPRAVTLALVLPAQATVGEQLRLEALVRPATPGAPEALALPAGTSELYCFVSADGLRLRGREVQLLRLSPDGAPALAAFELQAHLRGRRQVSVQLFAEPPDAGEPASIAAQAAVEVAAPTSPAERIAPPPQLDLRVAPQPDLLIQAEALPRGAGLELRYRLSSATHGAQCQDAPGGAVALSPADLARLREALAAARRAAAEAPPAEARALILGYGAWLYDRLAPPGSALRAQLERVLAFWAGRGRAPAILIVEDGAAWLPWELLAPPGPGGAPGPPLAERADLGRWVDGLGPRLYGELPFGEGALAHYEPFPAGQAVEPELGAWRGLLKLAGGAGLAPLLRAETPVTTLHLLRYAIAGRRDIAPRAPAATPAEEARRSRLDLRRKRPLIGLSVLRPPGPAAEDEAIAERVLPYLSAGAGALVAPWWPTDPAADRLFWPELYAALAAGAPLGAAVRRARLSAAARLPRPLDHLAYALFGDPRARPYWPERSDGYASIERLGPAGPLLPGQPLAVQVSLRSRPPVWYEDRLVRVDELPQRVQALFFAPGLAGLPDGPVALRPAGRGTLQATVRLVAPAAGDYPLVAQLLDGPEHLKTLQLTLRVGPEPDPDPEVPL